MDSIPKEIIAIICTFYYSVFQVMSSSISKDMTSLLQKYKDHIFKIYVENPQDDTNYEGDLYNYDGEFYYHIKGDGIKHGSYRIITTEINDGFIVHPQKHCLEQGTYENGKFHGNFIQYYNKTWLDNDKNFQPRINYIYKNGERDGMQTEYYADGSISKQIEYVNGKMTGYYKLYFLGSRIWIESLYEDGEIVPGTYIEYNYDGQIVRTA
ncbi:MORN-repeat protein [Orpheovirus IHUMI-LCC2]|uniref:MORN-repeat protein n=1 Tax=Orpheovirus IHUMI-LCC2 TaxID=2023057 RepID=A0A2I2L659_9VIRU|nr:MORN-repeat protein [Orpheovirus IHUMI-LCC2]SNW63023.1 MORN-repeat protein [Orpheovirus IHUMI-LCC2]